MTMISTTKAESGARLAAKPGHNSYLRVRVAHLKQVDHDLSVDRSSSSSPSVVEGCGGSAQYRSNPANKVLDHAHYTGSIGSVPSVKGCIPFSQHRHCH